MLFEDNLFYPSSNELEGTEWEQMPHRYDVYVNDDFVGIKALLTQSDRIQDINEFIAEQGISKFDATIDEDYQPNWS